MKCEICQKNEATVHAMITINGVTTEKMLCGDCWHKENASMQEKFSFNDLFTGFMKTPSSQMPTTLECPFCHMDLAAFRRGGLLGCEKCYDTFSKVLEPTFRRIQGRLKHEGKAPYQIAPEMKLSDEPKETDEKITQTQAGTSEIDTLRAQLAQAIENEEYEQAAIIRDKIKEAQANG